MVGLNGFEPATSPLSGVRSNQLSYRPITLVLIYITTVNSQLQALFLLFLVSWQESGYYSPTNKG